MQFKSQHLKKLAELSKLSLENEDESIFLSDLSSVVNWVDILKNANTSEIEPMYHPGDLTLRLRKDYCSNNNSISEILLNAPAESNNFFIVPRVVD